MFRVKIGEHITLGDISRGPKVVIECDHINELVDLFNAGIVAKLQSNDIGESEAERLDRMEKTMREYGMDASVL